jgi:hypothetical protein
MTQQILLSKVKKEKCKNFKYQGGGLSFLTNTK